MAGNTRKLPLKQSATPEKPSGWVPFESLRRDIDRLFDEWRSPSQFLGFEAPRILSDAWQIAPAMDLVETADAYVMTAELPGLDESDVELKLSNHTLMVTGEKNEEREETRADYHLSERRFGSFQRSFRVPEGVEVDKIEAEFAKGVLR